MTGESDLDREEKASHLAYEKGRRDAIVDSRLDSHDRRFALINGSIERGARATESLEGKIDELAMKIETADKVGQALARQATDAIKTSVTRREFWLGVLMVLAVLSGTLVAVLR